MRIFSSPKQSPRHSKNCLWKSAPHKRGSWSVVTLSHLKSCIHCFLHICLNIQMQIYALHSLKNLSYFWILQPRVDFTHIQNVLEYQSLIIDMHWKKVTTLMWNTPKGQTKLEIKGCISFLHCDLSCSRSCKIFAHVIMALGNYIFSYLLECIFMK